MCLCACERKRETERDARSAEGKGAGGWKERMKGRKGGRGGERKGIVITNTLRTLMPKKKTDGRRRGTCPLAMLSKR